MAAIRPSVRQFLLAGSTGDGWELDPPEIADILGFGLQQPDSAFLIGALRPTTAAVIDLALKLESRLAKQSHEGRAYVGLAICPPVDAGATQRAIRDHFEAVLEATSSAIAIYELPQVTGCSIAPETLVALAAHDRVVMFKDTSGKDEIAPAVDLPEVTRVRGAEGRYLEMLKPIGPYDGWLLSTGNVLGSGLRAILRLRDAGRRDEAKRLSERIESAVGRLFAAASALDFGNPFSNANRAGDHVLAYGKDWRAAPLPLTRSGRRLPLELVTEAEAVLVSFELVDGNGYLTQAEGNSA
jgi:dihydrodipicolinate synthase/N-acetylneuraminate lyase